MAKISYRTLALFSLFFLSCSSLSAAQIKQETAIHRSLTSIRECLANRYPVVCFKERALDLLNTTITSDKPMRFFNMVEISRNPKYTINNTEVEELPEDTLERNIRLNDVLKDKVEEYFKSRTIKFDMEPVVEEDDDDDDDNTEVTHEARHGDKIGGKKFYEGFDDYGGEYEGEKKKKCRGKGGGGGGGGGKGGKGGGYMMMGMIGMGCMMAQMMMGKVAFMAGTALIVAKIALFLSAIIGLKKLSSGGGGGGESTSAHVIYASDHGHGGGGGGGWHRSIDGQAAQTMAYRGYGDSKASDRWSKEASEVMCGGVFKAINSSEVVGYEKRNVER